jgi:hypothetical protein
MQWAHAVRLDLPEDASARETRWLAAAFAPMVGALEASPIGRASVALSGAALRALEQHGCGALLERVKRLAGLRQLELASTAMHGALLPLLPPAELRRQLTLSDEENLRVFGPDIYRPATLWSPHLATSAPLERVIADLGYTVLLVAERALSASAWPTDQLATSASFPGLTLVPTVPEACVSMRRGRLGYRELMRIRPVPPDAAAAALVTACDLGARSPTPRAFLEGAKGDRLVRVVEVVERLPATRAVAARAYSSAESLAGIAGRGPFVRWFRPREALNERQWALVTLAAEACESLRTRGVEALPAARHLRRTVDRAWRARFFEPGLPSARRTRWIDALAQAADGVRGLVPREAAEALDDVAAELARIMRGSAGGARSTWTGPETPPPDSPGAEPTARS